MMLLNYLLTAFLIIAPVIYLLILLYLLRKEIKEALLPITILSVLSATLLNKLLFFNQTLAQKDFNNIQIPYFQFFRDSILTYFLPPIWNSSFSGGFDAFASPLAAYFSVFNWMLLLGSNIYRAVNLFIFCQVVLCAIFSYLMLRAFKFDSLPSFLGSILYTFNGFVVMRLSEGVGIEYLYAYKWLPLWLLFTRKLLDEKRRGYLVGLAISLAFAFEGNYSQVIAMGMLWLIYLFTEYKRVLANWKDLMFSVLLGFCIYALKLLPFFGLVADGVGRFSGATGGWRQGNLDWDMFPRIFLPINFNYANAVFTPGVLGLLISLVGLALALAIVIKKRKPPFEPFAFSLITFFAAFLITIENPIYFLFYGLPVLKAVTQIPSFLIFYLVPLVFLATFFMQILLDRYRLAWLLLAFLPFAVFLEVLLGPATFGPKTYSFNFPKMEIAEARSFPHYNLLATQPPGLFAFAADESKTFFYPYGITQSNLKTLEGYQYFFGSLSGDKLSAAGLSELIKRTDYIFTLDPIEDDRLSLLSKVSMSKTQNFRSFSVYENVYDYLKLYEIGWNDDIYLYKTVCTQDCSLKNYSDNPVAFSVKADISSDQKYLTTSIAYSKWLRVSIGNRRLAAHPDGLGYLTIKPPSEPGPRLDFNYINPYIYAGFGLSFLGLLASLILSRRKD
ncbi:hypothetical protein KJ605_00235 [Patescibacteria group bacterium]|nr:hypothetical protein [Patescibacteria group bacterium]MBU1970197.1 hypothetical protein [Patescibacteria group bacterium]